MDVKASRKHKTPVRDILMHYQKVQFGSAGIYTFIRPASYDYKNKGITNKQIVDALVAANIRVVAQ